MSGNAEKIHIIFCKGNMATTNDFVDQLSAGMDDMKDADCYVMDLEDKSTINTPDFLNYLKQDNTFAVLINFIGFPIFDRGADLGRKYDIPVYVSFLDHPRNFPRFLMDPVCDVRGLALDRNHADFVREFYKKVGPVHFMPNGGFRPAGDLIPYKKRNIPVLYTGSCNRERPYKALSLFEDGGQEFYDFVIRYVLNDPMSTLEHAVREYYIYRDYHPDMETRFFLEGDIAAFIEENIRRYYKLEAMHALDDAGIETDVYGENWLDDGRPYSDRIHLHGRIPPEDCNLLPSDTKISLNFMPWFKSGCSERVFNNMLGGCLCVTDETLYLRERFEDRRELVYFKLNDLGQMAEDVKYYLDHEDEAEEIAMCGYNSVMGNDTWAHRMRRIIAFIREDISSIGS